MSKSIEEMMREAEIVADVAMEYASEFNHMMKVEIIPTLRSLDGLIYNWNFSKDIGEEFFSSDYWIVELFCETEEDIKKVQEILDKKEGFYPDFLYDDVNQYTRIDEYMKYYPILNIDRSENV